MSAVKKCIVWDLDNTLWDGICLEGKVTTRPEIQRVITELDQKGILHSIASRNEQEPAMQVLHQQGLEHFFVVPQINWLPKSTNIITISEQLNISLDCIAFIDDEPFERAQIAFMLPDVMTIAAEEAGHLPEMPAFDPGFTTMESKSRRDFYQAEIKRREAQRQFSSREDFLMSCRMKLSIRPMCAEDVDRVSELMSRTHQLNTTGMIFDKQKLFRMLTDYNSDYRVFVAELSDKFGWNGIIGTAVVECDLKYYRIIFFALSCRILGRGIERAFLAALVQNAVENGFSETEALYKNTGRNSMMRALYQMSGFVHKNDPAFDTLIYRLNNHHIPAIPKWVEIL